MKSVLRGHSAKVSHPLATRHAQGEKFWGVPAFAACCIEFVIASPGNAAAMMLFSAQAYVAWLLLMLSSV